MRIRSQITTMKLLFLFTITINFLFVFGQEQQQLTSQDAILIKIGEQIQVKKEIKSNQSGQSQLAGYYKFNLDKIISDEDLIVMVKGREDYTHSPSLYITKNEYHVPEGYSNDDYSCGNLGADVCTFPSSKLRLGQTYFIGVWCTHTCSFILKLKYEQEYTLEIGEQINVNFEEQKGEIIKIFVPDDSSKGDQALQHILIEVFLLNPLDVSDTFYVYLKQGEDAPTPSDYDLIGEDIWYQGKGIEIDKDMPNIKWKSGINYTLLVIGPENGMMAIRTEGYSNQRQIFIQKAVRDMVEYQDYNIYQLTVPANLDLFALNNTIDLSFDLQPYYGNPDLYVHYDTLPNKLEDFQWSSTQPDGSESLTITGDDIRSKNAKGQIFYVAIKGQSAATYRLLAYTSDEEGRDLVFDCTEYGYLRPKDIINYNLYIYDLNSTTVKITLSELYGNAQIYMKRCTGTQITQCEVTQDDIDKSDKFQSDDFWVGEVIQSNQQKIQFKYDATNCTNSYSEDQDDSTFLSGGATRCLYSVAVYGNSKKAQEETHYSLSASHILKHIQLQENQKHRSFLKESEFDNFKFIVHDDTTVVKIVFSVQTISGQVIVYASNQERFPDADNSDQVLDSMQDYIEFKRKNEKDSLEGTYYVRVKGFSAATYYIDVKVYRQTDDSIGCQDKKLQFGVPDSGHLHFNETETYYFKTKQAVLPDHKTNIFLYWQYRDTETNLRVHDDFEPNFDIYYLTGSGKKITNLALSYSYDSYNFIFFQLYTNFTDKDGKYYIVLKHQNKEKKNIYLKYQIMINREDIVYVIPDSGYIDVLQKNAYDNYEMFVSEPSQIYLELFQCIGTFEIFAAKNYQALVDQYPKSDLIEPIINRLDFHTLVTIDMKLQGSLYFSVYSKTGLVSKKENQPDESLYMIIPHILKTGQKRPHDIFYPPEQDAYRYYYDAENDQFNITLQGLQCDQDCKNLTYKPYRLEYILHITNINGFIGYFTKCDLDVDALQNQGIDLNYSKKYIYEQRVEVKMSFKQDEIQDNVTFIAKNLTQDNTYFIQVMAVLFIKTESGGERQPFTFLYPQFEIKKRQDVQLTSTNTENSTNTILIWIIVFGVIIIAIFGGYQYWKNRPQPGQARMYEMKDKPNKGYSQEEDEDDSEKQKKKEKANLVQ